MSDPVSPSVMNPAFSVVTESPKFVVINKSPGVSFHDEGSEPGICSHVKQALGYPVYPVHRLDKPTSGLLILPKSPAAARELTSQFSNHLVQKYYLALSAAKPSRKQGWVIGDMVKSRNGNWKLTRNQQNPAISYFYSKSFVPGVRCFLLRLYSGKTHQARVALKSIGAPIIGDERYGGGDKGDRLYLHAYALKFQYQGRNWELSLPPQQGSYFSTDSFSDFLQGWLNPWSLAWPSPPSTPGLKHTTEGQ